MKIEWKKNKRKDQTYLLSCVDNSENSEQVGGQMEHSRNSLHTRTSHREI